MLAILQASVARGTQGRGCEVGCVGVLRGEPGVYMAHTQRRRWLGRLLLVGFQLVIIVVGLEVGLRLLKPHHRGIRQLLYRSSEATRFERLSTLEDLMNQSPVGFRPNAPENGYVLNSRSFRTAEYDVGKAAGVHRVLAIGDSFTYGVVPDADHWTTLLEAELQDRGSGRVEVLRLGVPGTGTPFQFRLWQIEGQALDADLVILAFFVGNDFQDELGSAPGLTGIADRLSLVSYSWRLIRNLARVWIADPTETGKTASDPVRSHRSPRPDQGGYELPEFSARFQESRATMSEQEYLRVEAERMSICLTSERWKFDLRFRRVASLLRRFAEEIRDAGSELVVLIIPDEFQVDRALFSATAEFAGRAEDDYDLELPQEALRSLFDEHSISYVDLLDTFRQRALETRLYMVQDSHWNRAGNRLAAQHLLDSIAAATPRASVPSTPIE